MWDNRDASVNILYSLLFDPTVQYNIIPSLHLVVTSPICLSFVYEKRPILLSESAAGVVSSATFLQYIIYHKWISLRVAGNRKGTWTLNQSSILENFCYL